jgi:hypothetical protein
VGIRAPQPVSYGGVECEAVSLHRRQFERSFRQFVSDRVPGTQFESSQVQHALFLTARFPGDGQEARKWRLLRLRFGLRGDRFWPEGDFGRFVSGPRNPVSPMQIDLG